MQETTPELQETQAEKAKRWFQDNLRIIVSVAIVIIIAGGIYSYSKRSNELAVVTEISQEQEVSEEEGTIEIEGEESGQQVAENQESETVIKTQDSQEDKAVEVKVETSKETDSSFVETAVTGEGKTHLARRALANYLEKNTDSELTKEHKIYIEDYLRKNVSSQQKIYAGSSIEFSKDMIQKAIEQSKKLNDKQLQNLQKYSARVSAL